MAQHTRYSTARAQITSVRTPNKSGNGRRTNWEQCNRFTWYEADARYNLEQTELVTEMLFDSLKILV